MTNKQRKEHKSQINRVTKLMNELPSAPKAKTINKVIHTKPIIKKESRANHKYGTGQPHSNNF